MAVQASQQEVHWQSWYISESYVPWSWENSRDTNQGGAQGLAEPKASNDVAADVVVAVGGVAQCSMCCAPGT